MKSAIISSRFGLVCLVSGALLLGACAERAVILPGEREDVRADLNLPDEKPKAVNNVTRAIRIPGQSVNSAWTQGLGSPVTRVQNAALGETPRLLWSTSIGSPDGKRARITADPVVGGGLIYTLDSGARVSGVTPAGAVAWSTDLTPSSERPGDSTGGGLAYDNGTLYISSGFGILTALDASSGAVRWRQELDATGSGTPTVRDGIVYLVAGDETAWAINASNGRILWQLSAAPSVVNVLGAPSPALVGDQAIFGFGSGDVIAAFRRGGMRNWNASVAGQRLGRAVSRISDVTGSPVVAGNAVYAGNHSGRLAAFDIQTGEQLWVARQGALGPVWPAGDSIFAVTDINQLVRFDASNGSVIWAIDLPGFVRDKPRKRSRTWAHYGPILAGGRIVIASNDGWLRFFSPESGELVSRVEVQGGATTAPVVANQTLYVVGANGALFAFR
ncbi:outer membrane protein assembly factor BamB family protein [Pontibaca salina]|uniref:PQQ-binding-like beta-propeller repeat protein n=1 Tax=Pontibaca salina TaxID=2795731 RepID=A0A934LYX4_9RHOB|nr:PQQ-like beta-propeller repeat protein [Pontibaca salina]MBI6628390.1 PQQ-binding-like beta-propeller repeat protein [Pontibaca salina]